MTDKWKMPDLMLRIMAAEQLLNDRVGDTPTEPVEPIVMVSRPVGAPTLPFEAGIVIDNEYFWCADARVSSVVSSGIDSPHIKWACAILNQAVINEHIGPNLQ